LTQQQVGSAPDNTTTTRKPADAVSGNKIRDDSATAAGGDQRIRDLEIKLDKLLKEVDALRREIRRQQPGAANEPASAPTGASPASLSRARRPDPAQSRDRQSCPSPDFSRRTK
jgi:hypothetical protein